MPLNIEDHPWVAAAQTHTPQPMPTSFRLDPVSYNGPNGEKVDQVLMTVATPAGVTTVFLPPETVEVLRDQANTIINHWKSMQSPITLATEADMKREARAQSLITGNPKNGHRF